MFSKQTLITIPVKSGTLKTCQVRWPTDEEWADLVRKNKGVRIGSGELSWPRFEEAALDLFQLIRKDTDGPEFDQFEAGQVVARLRRVAVTGMEESADQFTVSLTVLGGTETVHTLQMPTARDVDNWLTKSSSRQTVGRQTIHRASVEPAAALYDKYFRSASGYVAANGAVQSSDIPIMHKEAVITEIWTALQVDAGEA